MVNLKISYPENFLEEETRCDHFISKEMKKVWLVELDLLAELDRVCKKYALSYYAMGGTLLGAVRHKGFIPWDDDIDVMMKREEYEKLCLIAKDEFKHPYFLQTMYSDFGATYGHAKFRNSETTCVFSCDAKYQKSLNQGIFIDVFPLDNVVENMKLFERQRRQAMAYNKLTKFFATSTKEAYRWHANPFARYTFMTLAKLFSPLNKKLANSCWKKFENICKKYNNMPTRRKSVLGFSFDKRWIQDMEDFKEIDYYHFEFTTVPGCKDFDHALTTCYGNWHKQIKGASMHDILINPDEPYEKFFIR